MRAAATCAAMLVLAVSTLASRVDAEPHVTLTVRLYNTSNIPTPELLAARRTADSILRDAGLDVVFRHCGRPLSPEDAIDRCSESLKPSEVVVRLIDAPPFNTTLPSDAYGMTYVVRETDRGWLATVFSDRIDSAAARAGVEAGTLLGRVMAHELGHLLLGVGYHGEAGLMRAEWPDALLGRTGREWRFSMIEAARMQSVLTSFARNRPANVPPL